MKMKSSEEFANWCSSNGIGNVSDPAGHEYIADERRLVVFSIAQGAYFTLTEMENDSEAAVKMLDFFGFDAFLKFGNVIDDDDREQIRAVIHIQSMIYRHMLAEKE